jgi:hypothetical protein
VLVSARLSFSAKPQLTRAAFFFLALAKFQQKEIEKFENEVIREVFNRQK